MADQTITVSYDAQRTPKFTFEENGQPLPEGNVTVHTQGTNRVMFDRKAGEPWTFSSFSMALAVWANDKGGSDTVTVGSAYGDSFSWTVSGTDVTLTDDNEVPANAVHGYEYSFVIDVPGAGPVTCDPKIYNRIN